MLRIHHPPVGESSDVDFFDLKLNGQSSKPWFCRVSALPYNTWWPGYQRPIEQTETAAFISFEMDEPVTLEIASHKEIEEAVVRPTSRGIIPSVCDDLHAVRFTIQSCGHYTLEINGTHNALHIFANPVSDFGVDKADPNVLYYGPGVYDIGLLELQDDQTLFVDGGAVLYGSIQVFHKKNVRILGYGVIDGSREERRDDTLLITWQAQTFGMNTKEVDRDLRDETTLRNHIRDEKVLNGCVHLYSCRNCEINGIIARDSATFAYILANCDRVSVEWAKTIGMWRYNSDGIDTFNSRYIRVANCFLRDFDDCMVIKGIKGWDLVNQHHISVTGCTIWCDWGSCLELGAETCADEYYDILWDDCDIIHASHVFMRLHNTDRAWVHDMLIRNIRCEYSKHDLEPAYQSDMSAPYPGSTPGYQPRLMYSPIVDGPYSNDHILGKVSNVRFENIQIISDYEMPVPYSEFWAFDADHANKNVVIENVTFNGRRLRPDEVWLVKNEWDDITVK